MVTSLGFRTDLALLERQGSTIDEHEGYTIVRTLENPSFHWGNFLLLHDAPPQEAVESWVRTFGEVFPGAEHIALGVDATEPAVYRSPKLECQRDTVLTASEVHEPPRPHTEAKIRRLDGDADWAAALELMRASANVPVNAHNLAYTRAKQAAMRELHEAGSGAWFGAFLDGVLASGLGVFEAGNGLARFQNVSTLASYRKRGLAGTLVHAASRFAFDRLGAHTLVIVADPQDDAIRVYRSVGFADTETQTALYHAPW
ncbi:GNAT family N-acetyltransferase [Sciscionella marina]|uniref:GNAT family N-acetyltransferase n=1 Tax=Sciscionella marina TaxID=508770 RepID=UPI00037A3AC0|nr:GNAT family N-acetyltransferase [Sciscionella marina]